MVLADDVDYLRSQVSGNAAFTSATLAASPEQAPAIPMEVRDSDDLRLSEEEEEIRFAQAQGFMSATEAESAIQALKH